MCAVLVLAFWEIQIASDSRYRIRAHDNKVRSYPIPAARGTVRDRQGTEIAGSGVRIAALVESGDTTPELLRKVSKGLRLKQARVEQLLEDASTLVGYEHLVLKDDLQSADLAYLRTHRQDFPRIKLVEGTRRHYGSGHFAVHAIGYVGLASRSDLDRREFLLVPYGAEIGKSGIERQYNHWLTGKNGHLESVVNSQGRTVEALNVVQPLPGSDLHLTIDSHMQAVAELGLEGRKGAAVAIEPNTGEVLVMASAPAFDPNGFVSGMATTDWDRLHADPSTPLLNRAIQGTWAMGSVFKPIVGLAGLEAGIAGPSFQVQCTGGDTVGGRYFRCHKHDGHGTVDLARAIAVSCDVYFYRLGLQLGIESLSHYAREAGLGERTGVDLPGEMPGLVPSAEWKVRRALQPWRPGETANVAIGQGAMAVTPLQAVHAIGGLANGGVWHQPRLVSDRERRRLDPHWHPPPPRTRHVAAEHLRILRRSMWSVVNGGGTGGQARLSGMEVCGKTGTSQRVSNSLRIQSGRADFEDDAWFVGFAPCEEPKIVVGALIENGKSSSLAAALVRDILQVWLLRQRSPIRQPNPSVLAAAGSAL